MRNKVLIVAAHSDDEVLGCGGTIAKLAKQGNEVAVIFMTNGVSSRNEKDELIKIQERKLHSEHAAKILGISQITPFDYPDNCMDTVPLLHVIQSIEDEIRKFQPEIVLTHFVNDLNIDHATVARATLTATRPLTGSSVKKVLGFEVNSSTEWAIDAPHFKPNYFMNISETFNLKIDAMRAYDCELRASPHPRSLEGIEALASLRGNASGYRYAEAFKIYRLMED